MKKLTYAQTHTLVSLRYDHYYCRENTFTDLENRIYDIATIIVDSMDIRASGLRK